MIDTPVTPMWTWLLQVNALHILLRVDIISYKHKQLLQFLPDPSSSCSLGSCTPRILPVSHIITLKQCAHAQRRTDVSHRIFESDRLLPPVHCISSSLSSLYTVLHLDSHRRPIPRRSLSLISLSLIPLPSVPNNPPAIFPPMPLPPIALPP